MSDKTIKAGELHSKGYNCAQAVACVFAEELGLEEKTVFRLMEGFGLGMGCMHTCGAVTGMTAVAGMLESDGDLNAPKTKAKTYKESRELFGKFLSKNGSVICSEIKGVETGKVLRSCNGCIEDAVTILEDYIAGKGD